MSRLWDALAATLFHLRRLARRHWPLVPLLLLLAYLVHAGIWGSRGWLALREAERRLEEERAAVATLRAERAALARRVEALRGPEVDADLVESELRRLGYVREDEFVILPDPPANAPEPPAPRKAP